MIGPIEMDMTVVNTIESNVPHIPVMLQEVIEYLKPELGDVFIDGTVGLGGHAKAIAQIIGPSGRLIAVDKDKQSLQIAREALKDLSTPCNFIYDDFRNIDTILGQLKIRQVDGILLDLGISSFQLDNPQRGFSFRFEGPLDMRMDQDNQFSASDLINSLSEKEIDSILKEYGEERWHHRIARYLVAERKKGPIQTTEQLSKIVLRAMPHGRSWQKIHPATRTFQALRIAVNKELENLQTVLDKCVEVLKVGGRMGVISFHSLEDRIVKWKFRQFAEDGKFRIMTKKPLKPSSIEEIQNPRARSACFRVAERV